MLTTFDRYLLQRFAHVFSIFLVAVFGLFVVFDLFTNVDDFQKSSNDAAEAFSRIALYYTYRSSEFFEAIGPILAVVAVIVVLAMVRKSSEIHPILAAGVPTKRLLTPLLIGTVIVNGALVANQELFLPSVAHHLQAPRGRGENQYRPVEPVYDRANHLMHIDGEKLFPESRRLENATFTLPAPALAEEMTAIKAGRAVYYPNTRHLPAGWLLSNLSGEFNPDRLTEKGRKIVHTRQDSEDIFIASRVSCDQLYNRSSSHKLVSFIQLVYRIRNPSTGLTPARAQSLNLHFRVTRPLLNIAMVVAAVPLVIRRESHSLIGSMALCSLVMGGLYLFSQVSLYLGHAGLFDTDFAAWLPVIVTGGIAAAISGLTQT